MRIVIDTNILASAVYFGGKPYQLLQLLMENKVIAVCSNEIVEEYQEIFQRLQEKYPKLSKKIPFSDIVSKMEVINAKNEIHVCRDADNDKFISCAVEGRCLYIVSGDKDLLVLDHYGDVEILTIAEFFDRYCL